MKTSIGKPLPFGATQLSEGINFAIESREATSVKLILYDLVSQKPFADFLLNPAVNKTGDIWHIQITLDDLKPIGYAYQLEGNKNSLLKQGKSLLDPYAKAVLSPKDWGTLTSGNKEAYQPLAVFLPHTDFNWENERRPQIQRNDLIIYEMHIRSFTQDQSSQVKAPGTFLGVIEKIPHLLELGVNAVELMPIQEFNECEYAIQNPHIHERLFQFWGYSTVNFFSPMNRYAFDPAPGAVINEFKTMVKALHQNGILVILDIVLNHTNEGGKEGPVNSFKGINCTTYYLQQKNGTFLDFTGCGNTLNTNEPLAQKFIIDVLRYWVMDMHVDGFRFDLASVFYRGTIGEVLSKPPILEAISKDPILSKTLLIAEPWDAAGLYQVGNFYPQENRWSEWNGGYRDVVRQFIKGTPNIKGQFASRLSGSQDIYGSRSPEASVNFIVAHDGFTLNDLVSYNQKHNLTNGENNHDGSNNNESWNCGKEGPTKEISVRELRERQMRNFHLALMISQGIPMILMGDEYGHTKKGNNNSWCHDNALNWFLWDKIPQNAGFYRYYCNLIEFRKAHPMLHLDRFLSDKDISWYGMNGEPIVWDRETQFIAFILHDLKLNKQIYCAFNSQNMKANIKIPPLKSPNRWYWVINTANPPPNDFYDVQKRPFLEQQSLSMPPFSALLLES